MADGLAVGLVDGLAVGLAVDAAVAPPITLVTAAAASVFATTLWR